VAAHVYLYRWICRLQIDVACRGGCFWTACCIDHCHLSPAGLCFSARWSFDIRFCSVGPVHCSLLSSFSLFAGLVFVPVAVFARSFLPGRSFALFTVVVVFVDCCYGFLARCSLWTARCNVDCCLCFRRLPVCFFVGRCSWDSRSYLVGPVHCSLLSSFSLRAGLVLLDRDFALFTAVVVFVAC
jgi:hypothetical protein